MKKTLITLSLAGLALVGAPPAAAAPETEPLRILLSNDDGYDAPGIEAVHAELTEAGHDVTIVAPAADQSGRGTARAFGGTVQAAQMSEDVWAVTGTPGDAVAFGLFHVFKDDKPDLVVSGTNAGQNIAALANHSGTVGAAVTALEYGVPAIAVSTEASRPSEEPMLNAQRHTADFVVKLVAKLRGDRRDGLLPEHLALNVNYPIVGDDGDSPATAWTLTNQDRQPLVKPSYTDRGDGTYTMGLTPDVQEPGRRSDVATLAADRISITPIEANWGTGPLATARAGALLRGLKP
ncbi:5'/3'-nucleotidase SurE [Actinomadura sp. WMMB 499]|uniref:5'/3'-nucleotidase SurE n=1 Tax=Actinomadura sp. WMMB 499 TaxID=1219491 RepID=UPI001246D72B|nr:5'/3'-nucleotidase SurE [Actinomadura sp. WMMB 499]QFG23067.1 5'/3'-nucleotidase SurE [Actinomadura sp. WMMB 499]